MLKNLTIKSRLIFVIAFLSLQLVVGGVIGIASLGFTNNAMKSLYEDRLVALTHLDQVMRLMILNRTIVAQVLTDTSEEAIREVNAVDTFIQKIDQEWAAYTSTYLTEEEKKLAEHFTESRKKFTSEGLLPAVAAIRANDRERAITILHGPMAKLFVPMREAMDELIKLQTDVAKADFEKSQTIFNIVRTSCIAGILFGLMLAFGIGVWLVRAISRPLEAAVKIAGGVAAGDLTQRIEVQSSDETGQLMQALKNMNDSLVQIVGQVRIGTDTIATASGQIAAGNLDLSSRTEHQASTLEETASSMEELMTTVRQNADNARQANQLAVSASGVAGKGGMVVSQVVDTMASINESSKKIVDIIGVIDGIAFQTNILALNAAVEAARAGEQGRGFAVVATEVRNLAQRSAAAAKEIKALIGDSVEKVDTGAKLVDQAGATMQEIVASVQRVTDIMSEITAASQEQTSGIELINQAIVQMDQVTQQNAALVEEAAAASNAMQDQAAQLGQAVSVFRLDGTQSAGMQRAAVQVAKAPERKNVTKLVKRREPVGTVLPSTASRKKIAAASQGDDWEEF